MRALSRIGRGEDGQAAIELVGLLPIAAVVLLALGQVLAAWSAREQAGVAAQGAAMGILQGRDPERAARAALPAWSRDRIEVHVRGRAVRVRLHPREVLPGTAGLLVAEATADAGPPA
jgi:kynureninase